MQVGRQKLFDDKMKLIFTMLRLGILNRFFTASFNSQLPILLTMAVCAAHGATSTSRPLMETYIPSLGYVIMFLHHSAMLPMRISTSRLGA